MHRQNILAHNLLLHPDILTFLSIPFLHMWNELVCLSAYLDNVSLFFLVSWLNSKYDFQYFAIRFFTSHPFEKVVYLILDNIMEVTFSFSFLRYESFLLQCYGYVQACIERPYPASDVSQILGLAVKSLHPRCSQNLHFYKEIETCVRRIQTQLLSIVPT